MHACRSTLEDPTQKQQTEEERKAEIDQAVEQRLATERQAQEAQDLAKREADLNAREKAIAEQQNATATQTPPARSTLTTGVAREDSEDEGGDYNIFYNKLEPYGDWRETSDYGYVWQPREAERSSNWHPYTEGRWVYTDAGWTWVSDESFGWATYHYGRWTRLRGIGWVWIPGKEWAPAWVSWRKSDEYVGWAPLPPEARFDRRRGIHNWSDNYYDVGPDQYRFVATREFGTKEIQRNVVPRERNITIINQTTNVTNITYSNTTIVNQGPSYEELRARSAQPIERLRLQREVNVDFNVAIRPEVRGEVIAIPAPVIAVGRPAERPRAVKGTIAQVTVEHGWENIDKQAAEQARTKMKSEATPPPDAPPKTFVKPAVAQAQPAATSSPSASAAVTQSAAPTATVTPTPTATATTVATATPMASATAAPSLAPTATAASTPPRARVTPKPTFSISPSVTPTPAQSPKKFLGTPVTKASPTSTAEAKSSASPSITPSTTPAHRMPPAPTSTPSISPSASPTPAATAFPSPTASETFGQKPQPSAKFRTVPGAGSTAPSVAASISPTATKAVSAPTSSPSPHVTLPPAVPASTPTASASVSLIEKQRKEEKEKKDRKHDRSSKEETPSPSPSATP